MVRLRALGECVFEIGRHRVTPEADVLFAVMMYLASNAGSPVPRRELIELLWPDSDLGSARHRLRQALYQLKRLGAPIGSRADSVFLSRADVTADHASYQRSAEPYPWPWDPDVSFDVLPRYAPSFSEPFARWVETERERVQAAVRGGLVARLHHRRGCGTHGEVIDLARACLRLDPLNEEATVALAESLALGGDGPGALAVIDAYHAELSAGRTGAPSTTRALRKRVLEAARTSVAEAASESDLVGRAELVGRLAAWLAPGASGSRVVAFVGEAGIGKTRLLREGARIAAVRGIRCVEYRSSPNGGDRPLAGLFDLLPTLLSLPGAVGCAPESYAQLSALASGVASERTIPEDTTDSVFRFATLRRSVFDLLDAALGETGLFITLDDAQWLDQQSLEILLDATARSDRQLSVLMAVRPGGEVAARLMARPEVRQVRVPPLDQASSHRIVTSRLAGEVARSRAALVDWAVNLANGNPFFLVELSAHCQGTEPREALPESLQVALQRKLDALSPVARLLVQACAILGQSCSLARLDRMLAVPPHETALALAELEATGLLMTHVDRIACRHDLIAEEVIRSLGAGVASFLHRRAAITLDEELRSAPTASLAWECVRHWDAAGEQSRALDLTGQISDQLLSLGLPRAAADLCERAVRYCRTSDQHAELLLRLSRARRLLDDWSGVIDALEKRRALLANRSIRPEPYSEDEIAMFEARWWRDYDGRVLRPALERVIDERAPTVHRLQMAVIALVIADNHQRRSAAELIARHVELIQPTVPREANERDRARLVYHTAFGNLDLAVAAGARVVESERLGGISTALLRALRWSSVPLKFAGKKSEAVAALTEAFHQAERLGLPTEMWHTAQYLSDLALDCEDCSLASEWAPICVDLSRESPTQPMRCVVARYISARVAFMQGDVDRASQLLSESRAIRHPLVTTRAEESLLALEVLLHEGGRGDDRSGTLERLGRAHLRTRASGVCDFETGALLLGLRRSGAVARARTLYHEYYSRFRRSRLPEHSILAAAGALLADSPGGV